MGTDMYLSRGDDYAREASRCWNKNKQLKKQRDKLLTVCEAALELTLLDEVPQPWMVQELEIRCRDVIHDITGAMADEWLDREYDSERAYAKRVPSEDRAIMRVLLMNNKMALQWARDGKSRLVRVWLEKKVAEEKGE